MTDDARRFYDAFRAHKRATTGNPLDALSQPDWDDVADLLARAHARWKPPASARPVLSARHGPPKGSSRAGGGSGGPGGQE